MSKKTWIMAVIILGICAGIIVVYMASSCGTAMKAEGPDGRRGTVPSATLQTVSDAGNEHHDERLAALNRGWLELPGDWRSDAEHCLTHWAEMNGKRQRNYTFLYDEQTYTSYWVAYPLCADHLTTGRAEAWGYDPSVPASVQTDITKGYKVSVSTENYPKNFYARGHQLPNADRNAVPEMQAQTYYPTNMTPQIQNGFNGGIWAKLEAAIRDAVPPGDTLYIITGASFRKAGENKENRSIVNANDGKRLPVPEHYWKAVMKVRRAPDGKPVDAVCTGFWLPHKDLKGHSYTEFSVSVDQIEEWTGFDLFINLPDSIESVAEADNGGWEHFRNSCI